MCIIQAIILKFSVSVCDSRKLGHTKNGYQGDTVRVNLIKINFILYGLQTIISPLKSLVI